MTNDPRDEAPELHGFAEHAEAQRRAWLRLSPRQRLAWLEGAKRFARLALEAARRRGAGRGAR